MIARSLEANPGRHLQSAAVEHQAGTLTATILIVPAAGTMEKPLRFSFSLQPKRAGAAGLTRKCRLFPVRCVAKKSCGIWPRDLLYFPRCERAYSIHFASRRSACALTGRPTHRGCNRCSIAPPSLFRLPGFSAAQPAMGLQKPVPLCPLPENTHFLPLRSASASNLGDNAQPGRQSRDSERWPIGSYTLSNSRCPRLMSGRSLRTWRISMPTTLSCAS